MIHIIVNIMAKKIFRQKMSKAVKYVQGLIKDMRYCHTPRCFVVNNHSFLLAFSCSLGDIVLQFKLNVQLLQIYSMYMHESAINCISSIIYHIQEELKKSVL